MSERLPAERPSASLDRTLPGAAALAAVLWVGLEFAFRRGLVPRLADPLGSARGADALMLAAAFPLIAGVVALVGLRAGIEPDDWSYSVSIRAVGAGIAGFLAYLLVYGLAAVAFVSLLGIEPSVGAGALGTADAPTWALALLFVGNGIVVPLSEELAWRGVIQTALTESYGTAVGVTVTALAFVAKHLVVDMAAPPFRVASLLVMAFVLGGLRARYGTASATVAHLAANAVFTAAIVV